MLTSLDDSPIRIVPVRRPELEKQVAIDRLEDIRSAMERYIRESV